MEIDPKQHDAGRESGRTTPLDYAGTGITRSRVPRPGKVSGLLAFLAALLQLPWELARSLTLASDAHQSLLGLTFFEIVISKAIYMLPSLIALGLGGYSIRAGDLKWHNLLAICIGSVAVIFVLLADIRVL